MLTPFTLALAPSDPIYVYSTHISVPAELTLLFVSFTRIWVCRHTAQWQYTCLNSLSTWTPVTHLQWCVNWRLVGVCCSASSWERRKGARVTYEKCKSPLMSASVVALYDGSQGRGAHIPVGGINPHLWWQTCLRTLLGLYQCKAWMIHDSWGFLLREHPTPSLAVIMCKT